ncbi:Apoptosis-inducing factor 2 [Trichoderma lentiforme]|uniref:Apoptosis-inducing factor 2 n=1 Tax=Trichoderma lentiforme TaxID=1567552 RepID=A0A9P4XFF7_9HYPO|nr:Apoptosis-inducing factor 2 [Trichoderma lentiforme]
MSSSTHNIVVLGSNFAGLAIGHYILRHIIPSVASNTGKKCKLTIVSPSTHYFFKVGAPRAISRPELVSKVSMPFAGAFQDYGDLYAFVQGEAIALDPSTKLVTVKGVNDIDENRIQIPYDSLIIATGTTSASPLWTLHGPHTVTNNAICDTNAAISKANTILIAGGGPTGVETAGEIAYHWHGKDIILFSGSTRLLSNLSNKGVGTSAESQLRRLNVKTVHMTKVTSASKTANGTTLVELNNGTTREVDLYIDATGGTPNTNFLPAEWLDTRGSVITDPETLRVTSAPAGVYAIGDVASYSKRNVLDVHRAIAPLGYSLWADMTKKAKVKAPLAEKVYKQDPGDFQFVPIGPKGGVGTAFGWSVPSFMIWLAKSRTFFVEKVPANIAGASYTNIDVSSLPN